MPAREQGCKLFLAQDPFCSACRPGDFWSSELECSFWLGLWAWTDVTLNYWPAASKVWWYSGATV